MRLPRWLAEPEAIPDAWAEMAGVVRAELARREVERERCRGLPPAPLAGLSEAARVVLAWLHASEHGRAFLVRLEEVVPAAAFDAGLTELLDAGLITVSPAVDEAGEMAEVIVTLRYDVELPGTEPSDG